MDFTFKTYENLLNTLLMRGFSFMSFSEHLEAKFYTEQSPSASNFESLNPGSPERRHDDTGLQSRERSDSGLNLESLNLPSCGQQAGLESSNLIILRHDVEARYPNALRMAQIQHKLGIKGTYYFRIYPKSGNEAIINQIAALGHEIGYHYDDLTACKGDHQKAIERFQKNLSYLRQFAPVQTICMEGAPESSYNNQDLWKKYDYANFGINSEAYLDLDFDKVYYLTDTGRRWDGKFAVRDKAMWGQEEKDSKIRRKEYRELRYRHTKDIIKAIEEGSFPDRAMLTFHPQRWNDNWFPWVKELVWQNVKNQGKRFLVRG